VASRGWLGMRRLLVLSVVAIVIVLAGLTYVYTSGSVEVMNAVYTETPRALAVYVTIHNSMFRQVCIVGVELAEQGSAMVELHETVVREGGVHEMRPVDRLCIGPRGTLEMKPGGYHIMVMGDNETLKAITEDKTVKIRIKLDNGETILVEAKPLESSSHETHSH